MLQYIDDDNSVSDVSDVTDVNSKNSTENGNGKNQVTSDRSDKPESSSSYHLIQNPATNNNIYSKTTTTTYVSDISDTTKEFDAESSKRKSEKMSDESDSSSISSSQYTPMHNSNNNNNTITTSDTTDTTDTLLQQQSEKEKALNKTESDTPDMQDSDENVDYNKQANNQSYSILTDPSAENLDAVFWQRFDELEKESDDKLVDHQDTKESLVSSGKFYVGDAHHRIEDKVKSGKIIEVGFHKYKKIN